MSLRGVRLAHVRAVDPRARWQSLQAHLSAARFALKMGDRDKAKEEIQTALSIDPEFLAARVFRDELDAPAAEVRPSTVRLKPDPTSIGGVRLQADHAQAAAKLAQFEARIRERVKDRHAVVPPRRPERTARPYRIGAGVAAVAAFFLAMAGSKIQEPRTLLSKSSVAMASLIVTNAPRPLDVDVTPGDDGGPPVPEPAAVRPAARPAAVPVSTPVQTQPQIAVPPPPQAMPTAAAIVTDSPPPALVPRPVDDRALVEEALSRYRRAYNRLDAGSAQLVYPAVNAPALARAFDGLESQSLQFDECAIDLRGVSARVTCRGTARYVTKIGSRDSHVEPRTWDFTLRKDQNDWKIENARAGR